MRSLILIGTILALSLTGCTFEEVEYRQVNSYHVDKLNDHEARLSVNVKLDNPNSFAIKITKTKLNLSVSGKPAGEIRLLNQIKIKRRSESDYDVQLEVDPDKITKAAFQSGLSILLTKKVTIRVKGWVKGKVMGVGKKVDVDESREVPIDQFKSL